MQEVFEVIDKTGRRIYFLREKWTHITSPQSLHPYMENYLEEIKNTLIKPLIIIPNKYDETKANYYKYLKGRKQYLLVVKYLNGEGFVLTAFITPHIKRR